MRGIIQKISVFTYKHIQIPLVNLLKEGNDPQKLSLAVSLGFVIGIFPVIGTTTILCAMAAVIFRLNIVAIQLVNYLVYPLQLALVIPYIKIGAFLFEKDYGFSLTSIVNGFTISNLSTNLDNIVHIFTGSLIVWSGISIICGFAVFKIIYPIFKKNAETIKTGTV